MSQLFESLDPSPFFEKDLDAKAEEYIVESFRDLHPRRPETLVVHLEGAPAFPEPDKAVGETVRAHFARQAKRLHRQLRQLLRRGLVSLGIGIIFLASVFAISRVIEKMFGGSTLATLIDQGLLIIGWVAMWRPLEIFLYDWWPIVGEYRIHDRLSRIGVQIVRGSTTSAATGSR